MAVKLSDGSFVSMAKIAGSLEYVSAMKQLAQAAEEIRAGAMPSLLVFLSYVSHKGQC